MHCCSRDHTFENHCLKMLPVNWKMNIFIPFYWTCPCYTEMYFETYYSNKHINSLLVFRCLSKLRTPKHHTTVSVSGQVWDHGGKSYPGVKLPGPHCLCWEQCSWHTPLGLRWRAARVTPKVPVEPNVQMPSDPFPSSFPPCPWCHMPSKVLTMPFLTCLFLLSFSSPSHKPLVPHSSFLPSSPFSLFLPLAHISWGPVLCRFYLLRTQQYPMQTYCPSSLQSRKQWQFIWWVLWEWARNLLGRMGHKV